MTKKIQLDRYRIGEPVLSIYVAKYITNLTIRESATILTVGFIHATVDR